MRLEYSVLIQGDGVAARCCAHLLARAGLPARVEARARVGAPAIMLSDQAVALIRDAFAAPALFAGAHPIDHRVVAWGSAPVEVPHKAIVLSERASLEGLPAPLPWAPGFAPDITIRTDPTAAETAPMMRFGDRRASAARVALARADSRACWIEALSAGWMFLIPTGPDEGWLLAVGGAFEALLAESRLIAPRVDLLTEPAGAIDASPRMSFPLQGDDWLACGAAALGFDPICGDGAANAVREAILASAAVAALSDGAAPSSVKTHYQSMLVAALRRHLRLCMDFYRSGGDGPWWDAELQRLIDGHAWCTRELAAAPPPAYELRGFALEPRRSAQ